jgi:hypothetical protein
MTDESDDEPVGRGRTPKHTRFKKGESGNRKRQYERRKLSAPELIEKELAALIPITGADGDRNVSKLEAILLQLNQKMLLGDRRALSVLMKFEALAARDSEQKVQLEYLDNDYSKSLSTSKKGNNDEGEI